VVAAQDYLEKAVVVVVVLEAVVVVVDRAATLV
jgi:hypothetical protein